MGILKLLLSHEIYLKTKSTMKRIIFLLSFLVAGMYGFSQPVTTLKKVLELKMPKTIDDDMPGTRGASVVWHPVQKKYYAVFAGNSAYPLAVFDARGNRQSGDELTALIDTRGLWFNPITKQIEGNGYSDNGWFAYKLNAKGIVADLENLAYGMNQPDAQCVGAYEPLSKRVVFLKGGMVTMYDSKQEAVDSIAIHWGRKKSDGASDSEDASASPEDYNYTSLICTGVKSGELGFLNTYNKQVEFYDIKSGYKTKTVSLPEDAIVEPSFNFAYANGIYWFFDIENRTWKGYK